MAKAVVGYRAGRIVHRVTLLRDIQDNATSTAVPVSTVLRRAQTLAFRLKHEPLKRWARNELDGYNSRESLPDYRVIGVGQLPVKGEFISPGGIMRNVPLAPSQVPDALPSEIRTHLFSTLFMQGVAEYEALLATGLHEFPVPWTNDEVVIMRPVWPGLSSAARMLPANTIAGMLDQVRNRILEFSLEIEQENPAAGEAGPGSVPVPEQTVTNIFNNTIYGGNNVITAAGRDATVTVSHTQIDAVWPDIEARLTDLGVPPDELEALSAALKSDGDPGTELGPATQSWIVRLTTKVATGGLALAQGVSVEMIVHALLKAFGLG
jgi:AbiTii